MSPIETLQGREAVEFEVHRAALDLQKIGQPLLPTDLVAAWIEGLNNAGIDAKHAPGAWIRFRNGGGRAEELPFVIEFPCPFGHRTEDRRSLASVRLIIEDDGWPILDEDSPCPRCTAELLEQWLMLCPRCYAGDESDEHHAIEWDGDPGMHPSAMYPWWQEQARSGEYLMGSAAPLAFVLLEIGRLARIPTFQWVVAHEAEILDNTAPAILGRDWSTHIRARGDDGELVSTTEGQWQVARARAELAKAKSTTRKQVKGTSHPATGASRDAAPRKLAQTPEEVAKWLTDHGVRAGITVAACWEFIKPFDGNPSKHAMEEGLAWLKTHPVSSHGNS